MSINNVTVEGHYLTVLWTAYCAEALSQQCLSNDCLTPVPQAWFDSYLWSLKVLYKVLYLGYKILQCMSLVVHNPYNWWEGTSNIIVILLVIWVLWRIFGFFVLCAQNYCIHWAVWIYLLLFLPVVFLVFVLSFEVHLYNSLAVHSFTCSSWPWGSSRRKQTFITFAYKASFEACPWRDFCVFLFSCCCKCFIEWLLHTGIIAEKGILNR